MQIAVHRGRRRRKLMAAYTGIASRFGSSRDAHPMPYTPEFKSDERGYPVHFKRYFRQGTRSRDDGRPKMRSDFNGRFGERS